MNYKYDGKTYTGTREEIIESLKHDLEHKKTLTFKFALKRFFYLGEEEWEIFGHGSLNVDAIKDRMICQALDKVPESYFAYDGKVYCGSKDQILKNIKII